MTAIFLCDYPDSVERVYAGGIKSRMEKNIGIAPKVFTKKDVISNSAEFANTQFVFSTWGMPAFSEEEITACFPKLKCVFYAAGSVQHFAYPFLNRGIRIFSAWRANAIPVAEYTVAQIVLATKGFFRAAMLMSSGAASETAEIHSDYPGNYDETVGLLGCGAVGTAVINLLKSYCLKVIVFDPFLSEERAKALHVELGTLNDVFSRARVISNHLANNADTKQMLGYDYFSKMRLHSVFLNTGRGAQVVEEDLARVLENRPDITAILDVTDPEPPIPGHRFYSLPNCILTPHIAGSLGNEARRMAALMEHTYESYCSGQISPDEVTMTMLKTMA